MSVRGSEHDHEPTDGYILIQAHPGNAATALAELVTQIPGVVRAERVYGAYDAIAAIREPHEHSRASPAARAIRELDGVLRAIPLRPGRALPSPRSRTERQRRKGAIMAGDWNRAIIEEFRANGGKVGGQFEGAPLLLLHSVGAKSGKTRVSPMMYQDLGNGLAVFASKGGAPTNPDWYHNIVASKRATVEVGTETFDVTTRVAQGEERERIWTRQKELYPGFGDYERRTSREIPVIILEPVAHEEPGSATEQARIA